MRKLLIFLLCALGSVFISFILFDEAVLNRLIIYLGYPSIFLSFLLWMNSLYVFHRGHWNLRQLFPQKRLGWAAILAVSALLLLYEPIEFKIVFDEVILSSSAQLMHFSRIAGIPQWANDYSGSYLLLSSVLDKRPLFFPFLISLVHDFTGYRYSNVFALNGILTFVLMALIYSISRMLSNHRAGILAVLLAGSLPLLSISATSGHFEILNLVMITLTLILSFIYLNDPNEAKLVPFALCLILLSQVRYENCVYLLPYGIVILLGWHKSKRIILPWQVIICPLLLIVPSMHYRLILDQENGFFQSGPKGRDQTFSLSYAAENLESAIRFLYSHGQSRPNAYLLSILGLAAVVFFLFYALKRSNRCSGVDVKATVAFVFFISIALLMIVITFFNFGLFDQYITSRLSLPLHLLWIILIPFIATRFHRYFVLGAIFLGLLTAFLSVVLATPEFFKQTGIQFGIAVVAFTMGGLWAWKNCTSPVKSLSFLVLLYILTVSMPVGHAHRYSQIYVSNDMVEEELAFLKERSKEEKILWISSAPYTAFLLQVNSVSPVVVNLQPEILSIHLSEENYDAIYSSQRMKKIGLTDYTSDDEMDILNEEVFMMETVRDVRISMEKRLLIKRITGLVPRESETSTTEAE